MEQDHCANCEALMTDSYCGRCGQERVAPITWTLLVQAAVAEVATVDGPLLRTLRELTLRPGATARDFLSGRRKRYIHPVKYVLITATFVLLVLQLWNPPRAAPTESHERVANIVLSLWGYYLFAILVPVAGVQRLLHRRSGERLAECYVFSLFVFGHILWLNVLSAVFGITPRSLAGLVIQIIQMGFALFAVHNFYRERIVWAVGKGFVIYAVYIAAAGTAGFATSAVIELLASRK